MPDAQHLPSIPIECLRTVVAVAETGTFVKAGQRMGISQPAVSAQLKRVQQVVGGEIFEKSAFGSSPTSLGEAVIAQARKVLDAHDQILRLGAADLGPVRVRLGISSLLIREFLFAQSSASSLANLFVQSDGSLVLARSLLERHLDIVCCFAMERYAHDIRPFLVAEREEQLVWARAKTFVLSPGAPLPLVTWRGDERVASVLREQGLAYQTVFDGDDYEAKRSVVEAGLGLMALPERLIPAPLVRAKEYYLPELPTIRCGLYVRSSQPSPRLEIVSRQLQDLFFTHPSETGAGE
jgi:DNA-binding transcriptional LysR family regulator